ncbi:carbohydrate ABC transporter permease [Nonomuraea sp. B5E05]|uniref:carbohydrate ABC transporter permease n=1 Tax=Nonomuraea sp. B5E05 TaxID=3153569 RepID=UPI0032604981
MVVACATTTLALLIAVRAAYALVRLPMRGKPKVLAAVLCASMFPGVAILTPMFQLFTDIRWLGTYQALIVPNISFALPLALWILTSFFAAMPWELEKAALADGATPAQAFCKVLLPLAVPGLFTTAIIVFFSAWDEYLLASLLSSGNPP